MSIIDGFGEAGAAGGVHEDEYLFLFEVGVDVLACKWWGGEGDVVLFSC